MTADATASAAEKPADSKVGALKRFFSGGCENKPKPLEKQLEDLKVDEQKTDNDSRSKGDETGKKETGRRTKDPRMYQERLKEWEDKQKTKTVLEKDCKGQVKWYSVIGHYGFIERDNGEGDVFVHQSAITNSTIKKVYHRSLADDQPVQFDLVQGEKGLEAVNVSGPDGKPVKQSVFRPFFRPLQRTVRKYGKKPKSEHADSKDNDGKPVEKLRRPYWRKNRAPKTDDEEKPKHERRRRQKSASSESKHELAIEKSGEDAVSSKN